MYDYDDEDCCVGKDCVGDCLVDIEECFCECHKDSSKKHKYPCCFVCSLCGIKIKISLRGAHGIRCRVSSGC